MRWSSSAFEFHKQIGVSRWEKSVRLVCRLYRNQLHNEELVVKAFLVAITSLSFGRKNPLSRIGSTLLSRLLKCNVDASRLEHDGVVRFATIIRDSQGHVIECLSDFKKCRRSTFNICSFVGRVRGANKTTHSLTQ
ncbi:hypothetical protein Godav_019911, partial [Gossypium davidsonii]|nr:hypothetical protein [Gossypium davidsonii]